MVGTIFNFILLYKGTEHTRTPNYKLNRLAKVIQSTGIYGHQADTQPVGSLSHAHKTQTNVTHNMI